MPGQLGLLKRHGIEDLSEYRIFTFVRDPYSWTHSVWNNFYRTRENDGARLFHDEFPEQSFPDFLRFIERHHVDKGNSLWGLCTQSSFFRLPNREPDFLGRFEDYEAEVHRLLTFLGLPPIEDVPQELIHKNPGLDLSLYDAEGLEILNHVMDEDFRTLGYEKKTVADLSRA